MATFYPHCPLCNQIFSMDLSNSDIIITGNPPAHSVTTYVRDPLVALLVRYIHDSSF